MAPKRVYPRSAIRRIVKAHTSRSLSKNTEVLVSQAAGDEKDEKDEKPFDVRIY